MIKYELAKGSCQRINETGQVLFYLDNCTLALR